MKVFAFFLLFLTQTSFACSISDLRKDLFTHFTKTIPVTSQVGEHKGTSTLKEISLTDTLIRVRGEDFFITKLVLDVLWTSGHKEEKEVLMAAMVDMATCRIESFEPGDVQGSTISKRF